MKVLVAAYSRIDLWTAPEWFVQRLKADFPQVLVTQITSGERLAKELSDATGQGEHHGHHLLSHHRPVYFPRIRQDDLAVDELRKK